VGLHLLLLWPTSVRVPQQTPGASPIKAELRASAQVPFERSNAPNEPLVGPPPSRINSSFDSAAAQTVPNPRRTKPMQPTGNAAAPSRDIHPASSLPLLLQGDALTRYRLGLAWQLGRDARLKTAGSPTRPVTVELAVMLADGRVIGVEVTDDGGFASLAATAAEQARHASRVVPVPLELGDGLLRVSLALRFEP
jgi:hypothetical protein